MKKEARLLLDKAIASLILSIEHFNKPSDLGRSHAVLILLDHSFEMLLKACLLHKGGRIRERGAEQTIGFDACVRRGLSTGNVQFLTADQALSLQIINSLRDAAQHHLVVVSESQLYMHSQAGVTLFRDLLATVFAQDLLEKLPSRVLPISTQPPTDLATLFDHEVVEIQKLLLPGTRRRTEATARLKALAIVESAVAGRAIQPSDQSLAGLVEQARQSTEWTTLFPGVASLQVKTEGSGPSIAFRITKKEGIPVHLVPEGTPGAATVAVKRVGELDFYSLGRDDIAKKVGLSGPKTTAIIRFTKLQDDEGCFKEFIVGRTRLPRYSPKAIDRIKEALSSHSIDEIWKEFAKETGLTGPRRGGSRDRES
jgi:hypothetical protein